MVKKQKAKALRTQFSGFMIITALESHQSDLYGATVPDFESQQLYAAKGSLHE